MVRFSTGTTSILAAVVFASQANNSSAADVTLLTPRDHTVAADANADADADAGILTPAAAVADGLITGQDLGRGSNRKLVTASDLCGSAGYVDCVNGIVRGGTDTCATACGAAGCCVGDNACSKFTGKVCKDGSCYGSRSCNEAVIPIVANSCKTGYGCTKAGGGNGGSVGNFVNSCNGDLATPTFGCYKLGYNATVGNVVNSCNSNVASDSLWCSFLGTYGVVGNIESSCNGASHVCDQLASKGNAGDLKNSCNSGPYACWRAGCGVTELGPGSIQSVTNSCNAERACQYAGVGVSISSNMLNCCNSFFDCSGADEAFIASHSCLATDSPSSAPSFSPTMPKTSKPTDSPSSSVPSSSPTTSKPMSTTSVPSSSPTTSKPMSTTSVPTTSMPTATAPPTSPVDVTLSFVGGCPAQVNDAVAVHYEPGDRISKGAIVFECTSWPLSLFCSQQAFDPPGDLLKSKSDTWKQAWKVIGRCTGTIPPPVTGCPDAWTSGDMTMYKENDQVSVIKSSSPLIQIIYKCKAWPYSWYCGQLSPLNHNGGVLGWEYVGECTGTIGPTVSPTFDPLSVISGCPDEYKLAAIKNYVAGDKVSVTIVGSSAYKNVYVCREFPYSGYCSQSGFGPGEQYGYMAWTLLGPCDGTLAPTSAPTLYIGGAPCTYPKAVTGVITPVETWSAGTLYEAGDQVRIGAKKFQCKPWPFFLWCRMSAYAPTLSATGLWTEAWSLAGTCPTAV